MSLSLPSIWTGYILRDPSGRVVNTSPNNNNLRLTGIAQGRYQISSFNDPRSAAELVTGDYIPGGALLVLQPDKTAVTLTFDDGSYSGAYQITTFDLSSGITNSYYTYHPENSFDLAPGKWQIKIARPSESGFTTSVEIASDGSLAAVNSIAPTPPRALVYPVPWSSYTVIAANGDIVRRGGHTDNVDITGLKDGQYSLIGVKDGLAERHSLVVSSDIPGGAISFAQTDDAQYLSITIANFAPQSIYRLKVTSPTLGTAEAFNVYRNQTAFSVPNAGDWTLSLAPIGSNAKLEVNFTIASDGSLSRVNKRDLIALKTLTLPEGWTSFALIDQGGTILRSGQNLEVADLTGIPDGRYIIKSGPNDSSKVDVLISTQLPGGVMAFEQPYGSGAVLVTFAGVTPDKPVLLTVTSETLGVRESFYVYSSRSYVNVPVGSWDLKIARPGESGYTVPLIVSHDKRLIGVNGVATNFARSIALPTGWAFYAILDPSGNVVRQVSNTQSASFSGIENGRYSLKNGPGDSTRHEIVVSDAVIGGVLDVRSEMPGKITLSFSDPLESPYYLVRIYDAQSKLVSSAYYYSTDIDIALAQGDYSVSVTAAGGPAFQIKLGVDSAGSVAAVDGVGITDRANWYSNLISGAAALGPVTFNNGSAHLSFARRPDAAYLVQIREEQNGRIATYVTSVSEFSLDLVEGKFAWRAFAVPKQAAGSDQLEALIASNTAGWTSFEQRSDALLVDYVLGIEPDQIFDISQLSFNYPGDSLKLADGSILIANTLSSNLYRIYSDNRVELVAGGFAPGYVASGNGPEVLLNQPTQMLDMGDGTVLFADNGNYVVRKLTLDTGEVETLYGDPTNGKVRVENGQIVALGEIFAIGKDNEGRLFISAGQSRSAGDYRGQLATLILRQAPNSEWDVWEPDVSSLGVDYRFTDVLFTSDAVWVSVQTEGPRFLVKYNPAGTLLGKVEIASNFGSGLVYDALTDRILIADHTQILSIDPLSMDQTSLELPVSFANVASIEIYGALLLVTDSDSGKIFTIDRTNNSVVSVIGRDTTNSNVIVDLEEVDGRLRALDNQTPQILEFSDGSIRQIAGTGILQQFTPTNKALAANFLYPNAMTTTKDGISYIVESNHRILRLNQDGSIENYAGDLTSGYSGDNGSAADARFRSVYSLDVDTSGALLVADSYNHSIRRIDKNGTVTTIVGNGTRGLSSLASDSAGSLNTPLRILATDNGRTFISDSWNNRVVELTDTGELLAIAGVGVPGTYQGQGSFGGDGGLAADAQLNTPNGLAYYSADDTLFIVDTFNNRVRYVDSAGYIHTLIGSSQGFEFGQKLNLPSDAVLIGDDLYVADSGNALVLKFTDVDRTGNDYANSLHVDIARQRLGGFNRDEHVNASDVDIYAVHNLAGSLFITAEADGLALVFSAVDQTQTGTHILGAGEVYELTAGSAHYLTVSANVHQGYNVQYRDAVTSSTYEQLAISEDKRLPVDADIPVTDSSPHLDVGGLKQGRHLSNVANVQLREIDSQLEPSIDSSRLASKPDWPSVFDYANDPTIFDRLDPSINLFNDVNAQETSRQLVSIGAMDEILSRATDNARTSIVPQDQIFDATASEFDVPSDSAFPLGMTTLEQKVGVMRQDMASFGPSSAAENQNCRGDGIFVPVDYFLDS